jgi:hypothetical protein
MPKPTDPMLSPQRWLLETFTVLPPPVVCVANRDMTVRAGSSSTCWLSMSAKLNDIRSSLRWSWVGSMHRIDSLPMRLLPTLAR